MTASFFLLLCHLAFHPPTSSRLLPSFSLSTARHHIIPPSNFKQAASFLLSVYCSSPHYSTLQLQAGCFLPSLCLLLVTTLFHPPTSSRLLPSFSLSTARHHIIPPSNFKQAASFLLSVYCSSPHYSTLQLQAGCFLPSLCLLLVTTLFHPPTSSRLLPSFSLSTARHHIIPPSNFKQAASFLLSVYCSSPHYSTLQLQAGCFLPSLCLLLVTTLFHPPTSSRLHPSFSLSTARHHIIPPSNFKQAASFLLSVYCSSPHYSTLQLQAGCFLPSLCLLLVTTLFHPPTSNQAASFL